MNKHTGRVLTWKNHLGQIELRAFFPNGKKHEIVVPPVQMLILNLFNERDSYRIGEIQQRINLQGADFKKYIIPLFR